MREERIKKIKKVVRARQRDIVLVLEDIYDPHNAAAILRTADAFGIQTVYFIFNKTEPYNPKQIGKASSSSANKWLTYYVYKRLEDKTQNLELKKQGPVERCLHDLKSEGYEIVATAIKSGAVNLYEFEWPKKIALLVGNEHAGISETAQQLSDHTIFIPMKGFVQSLNVSVATALCIGEISRTRLHNNYSMAKKEQEKLIEEFERR